MGEWMGACVRIVCVHAREIEDGRRGGGRAGQKGRRKGKFLRKLEIRR
jgi:hypothetical protein